jgi:type IV secretion system coupling TraD/TrwB family protein
MFEFNPDPETLIMWLSDAEQIGQIVANTELAHYVDPGAKEMRGSVLATLAQVGKTLRLLPRPDECEFDFSLTEWAQERRGWLFLTATKETEERLRPLYAAYLDLLMRRLMSVDDEIGRRRPVKLIVDEVHTLNYLATLYKATTEGRKFGLHVIQGTQNKAQYDARYGHDAATMLSCPRYTILLRCKEPGSAKWLSSLIGDEERERPRTGVTASVSDQGRDSMNYSTQTERRPVISKEEISALPNLAGYWKYGNSVVPFRFDFIQWKRVAQGFVPRQTEHPTPKKSADIPTNDDTAPPKTDDQKNVWELLREDN